jgi:formate dehydrogenase subunit gamma
MHTIAQNALKQYKDTPGALLPVLHAIQNEIGHIPDKLVGVIAEGLNLSRAEVHGVISFYHFFRTQPRGKHLIQICRAEACQAMGSKLLEKQAKALLGIDYHETSEGGVFSLEPVYCLGNCACTPSIMIDNEIHGRVNSEGFEKLITPLRQGAGIEDE